MFHPSVSPLWNLGFIPLFHPSSCDVEEQILMKVEEIFTQEEFHKNNEEPKLISRKRVRSSDAVEHKSKSKFKSANELGLFL